MLEIQALVVEETLKPGNTRGKGLAKCFLCAAPIALEVPALCPLCLDIEASNERAYREEQEQARRPF